MKNIAPLVGFHDFLLNPIDFAVDFVDVDLWNPGTDTYQFSETQNF